MKSPNGLKRGLIILLATVFVLVSVGTAGATAKEHLKKLHEAAKAEGQVIWHTAGSTRLIQPVVKTFQKQYPDINLKIVNIGSSDIASRLISESAADRVGLDVSMAFLSFLDPLIERDLLVQYDWVKHMEVDPKKVIYDNRFVTNTFLPRIWIYNTKMVSKADVPKSLEDVLDPRWKGGKISIRAAASGFTWLWPIWKKDKKRAIDFLTRFAKQDILPEKRETMVGTRIASGECPLGATTNTLALMQKEKGALIKVINLGPVASEPSVMYIPKKAPHPNAAKFFLAWLISDEGIKAFRKQNIGPPAPAEAGPQAKILSDAGIDFVPIATPEDMKEYKGAFSEAVMKIMNFIPK